MSAVPIATAPNEIVSEIVEFYNGKSIFITGATGFLGKCLIEKLLRSCVHVDKIYLLVRPKKGKTSKQRLDEIVKCKVNIILNKIYSKSYDYVPLPLPTVTDRSPPLPTVTDHSPPLPNVIERCWPLPNLTVTCVTSVTSVTLIF
jgi:hypothetical protein